LTLADGIDILCLQCYSRPFYPLEYRIVTYHPTDKLAQYLYRESAVDKALDRARDDFRSFGGLESLAKDLANISEFDIEPCTADDDDDPYDGGRSVDVRLRYHSGSFSLNSGDSSYDQDHRGDWGASSVGPDLSQSDAMTLAEELLEEVLDSVADRASAGIEIV
jgi:hypothetical protein